jgi:PHD/YefM family antitoxin component YafN of YafNO toxin-antitoxin module
MRSLSAKDLMEFELDVLTTEVQARSEQLLERLDDLAARKEALIVALEEFRSAERFDWPTPR